MTSQAEASRVAQPDQGGTDQQNDTDTYVDRGDTKSTWELPALEQQVEQQRELHGSSAPETLEALHDLSLGHQFAGQWEKAEALQRDIISTRRETLGDTHPDTLRSTHELCMILSGLGQDDACENLQLEVLATRESVLGNLHLDTIESMEQLAI